MTEIQILWREGDTDVRWRSGGDTVVKPYRMPPATVTAWADPPSVIVVVEPEEAGRLDNAIVYEPDGTERLRLVPPPIGGEPDWKVGFYAVYADPQGLVAVFTTTNGDYWGRPDLTTGELAGVAEWR